MSPPIRVMTVCSGNICRSPMAQAVLAVQFAAAGLTVAVDSTGISNEEHGHGVDHRARDVLEASGYAVPNHRARQVTLADLRQVDLMLPMTLGHLRSLASLAQRAGVTPEIRMLRTFDPNLAPHPGAVPEASTRLDLPDPWYGGRRDFEDALAAIEASAPGVVAWVDKHLA